ncbi:MAG: M20/M25/M40 family metallo-hydrolase, partial [Trueperaceae bacterium]
MLRGAVSIASPSGFEDRVACYLVERMKSLGGKAYVDASGSAVATIGSGPLKVMFLGHIDTVAGDIPVRIEDDCLYGRGTVDAKGPFCAAIAAASRLTEETLDRLSLTLIGATEEEAPSSKGARHALAAYPRPDLLIIGEPSGWDAMTLGYKGRLVLRVVVAKPNHHSAGSESSAADDAVRLWNRVAVWVAGFNRAQERIFDQLQATLQSIATDDDGLEQRCTLTIGFRLPPRL